MPGVKDASLMPRGYSQITGLSSAKGLAGGTLTSIPKKARYALIKPTTQPVRWRDDGTNPTSALGILIDIGDEFMYTGKLAALKLIETAASATVDVAFYS